MRGMSKWAAIRAPCVPLPAPGGPIITIRIAGLPPLSALRQQDFWYSYADPCDVPDPGRAASAAGVTVKLADQPGRQPLDSLRCQVDAVTANLHAVLGPGE